MAQQTVVELVDDIDGRPADQTVRFSLDGVAYEIDLSTKNANILRANLAPFVEKARKASVRAARPGQGPRATNGRERSADIRTLADQNGTTVNDRDRISSVTDTYEADDPSRAKPAKHVPTIEFRAPQ
ncbi:Lsr2 family protein [Actinomadura sp. 6N118]|uniref:Lsr2 family protein n=1 Tax=Actinomadura sp. 6N118 TaxID=3375151 RepID=UPI003796822A